MLLRIFSTTLFILFSYVSAQDRAYDLVENARLTFAPENVHTLEVRLKKVLYFGGEIEKSEAFFFVDLDQDSFYAEQTVDDVGKLQVRVTPNHVSVTADGRPLPENIAAVIAAPMRAIVPEIVAATQLIPRNYELISYDGMQTYNDLVSGEQVTLRYNAPGIGDTLGQFIFGELGELLGVVADVPIFGKSLLLYDVFGHPEYLRLGTTMYAVDGEAASLIEERYYNYIYNRPTNPSYFTSP